LLHGCFLLFNPPDFSHTRALAQVAGECVKLLAGTGRIDLNPAIVLVAHPTPEADQNRVVPGEPAKADTLHAAGNKPPSSFGLFVRQRLSSASLPASISARTAALNALILIGLDINRKPFSTT